MVGGVFRVYKCPLGPAVEMGGLRPLRLPPPPASRGQASRRRVVVPARLPPPKRRCARGDRTRGLRTAQSPMEGALLATIGLLVTMTRMARGGAGGTDPS